MWGCMTWNGVGFASKIDGRMDGDLYLQILKDELCKPWSIMVSILLTSSFGRIMTLSYLQTGQELARGARIQDNGLACTVHRPESH